MKIKENFESLDKCNFKSVAIEEVRKGNAKGAFAMKIYPNQSSKGERVLTPYECFSEELKMEEVFPIFIKKDSLDKENHRPVSILSHISTVSERLMYK